jgi:hypothetical protein
MSYYWISPRFIVMVNKKLSSFSLLISHWRVSQVRG